MTRVKVCCIRTPGEARAAIAHGAAALGLVSAMPSGPGVVDESTIAAIAGRVPPPVGTFLLTSATTAEAIVAQQRRCRTSAVQICDRVTPAVHRELREALPGIALIQVVHVVGADSVAEAAEAAELVDALLLDSGDPRLPVKQLGGTGRTHDWRLSARIVAEFPVPVFLAGGLDASNVGDAIRAVRPWGVDLCSGVRTNGDLDPAKLRRFFAAVAEAG